MQLSVTTSFKGKRMIQTNETQLVLGGATVPKPVAYCTRQKIILTSDSSHCHPGQVQPSSGLLMSDGASFQRNIRSQLGEMTTIRFRRRRQIVDTFDISVDTSVDVRRRRHDWKSLRTSSRSSWVTKTSLEPTPLIVTNIFRCSAKRPSLIVPLRVVQAPCGAKIVDDWMLSCRVGWQIDVMSCCDEGKSEKGSRWVFFLFRFARKARV